MEQFNETNFFGKYFRLTFVFAILTEIFSYCAYLYPSFNPIVFFAIVFLALILSLIKLEYGLYILLAELFIGSKGYLFSLPFGGLDLSLRMGLFLAIMSVWLVKVIFKIREKKKLKESVSFFNSNFFIFYILYFIFLLWGVIFGLIRGNSSENLFFDFNGWIYFLLIFPFFEAIKDRDQVKNIFQVLIASLLVLGVKTIFLFYIFSHQINIAMISLYYWVRRSGIGEITMLNTNFYRIFFQSQIYNLMGFFIFFPVFIKKIFRKEKSFMNFFGILLLCALVLLVSFSRSFWVGLFFGAMALPLFFKFSLHDFWKKIFKISYYFAAIFLVAVFVVIFLINFPKKGFISNSFGGLIQKRVLESGQEAAGRSRIDLLPPLFKAIARHPVIGSGFGSTVTYKSSDPRVVETNREGWYTTYAFEWGYLDIWLKIGLAGLLVYLGLIWKIFKEGWNKIKNKISNIKNTNQKLKNFQISDIEQVLILGMLIGLLALLATNFFSPYLNHPLGIGYIMLCSVIFEDSKFKN